MFPSHDRSGWRRGKAFNRETLNSLDIYEPFVVNNLGKTVNSLALKKLLEEEKISSIDVLTNSNGDFDSFEKIFQEVGVNLKDLDHVLYLKDYVTKKEKAKRVKLDKHEINCYKLSVGFYNAKWERAKNVKTDEQDFYYVVIDKVSSPVTVRNHQFYARTLGTYIKGILDRDWETESL